jgi:hypothetical protein
VLGSNTGLGDLFVAESYRNTVALFSLGVPPTKMLADVTDGIDDDCRWTAGNDSGVSHECLVDSGSFGRVHKVNRSCRPLLTM